jgi:large repetitive protein
VAVTDTGATVTFNFGNIINGDSSNGTPETITIVYRAVVLNTNTLPTSPGNQQGAQLNDSVHVDAQFTDSPAQTGAPTAYTVAQTGATQPVAVVEPNLTLSKGVALHQIGPFTASIGTEAGDTVFYQVSISNSTGGPAAFDATLSDPLPTSFFQIENIVSVTGGGLTIADFVINNNGTLQTVNPVDIAAGTTISILVQAQIINSALDGQEIDNTARVQWTSLDGTPGVRSIYNPTATERTGADGPGADGTVLNNYAAAFTSKIFIASPGIDKRFQGGSLTADDTSVPTAGTNPLDDVVVGESITYDVLVNLPEGVAANLRIADLVPSGLRLDTTFNNGTGFQIITTSADSDGQLRKDFSDPSQLHPTLSPGGNGISQILNFGDVTVTADQDKGNNAFLIRVRAIVTNVASNQTGTTLINGVIGTFTDPNTGTETTLNDQTPNDDAVTVVEPNITVTKAVDSANHDAGDPVTYTVTFSNIFNSTSPDGSQADAYDVNLTDTLPAELLTPSLLNFTVAGFSGAFTAPSAGDFEIANVNGNNVLRLRPGVTLDMPLGSSIAFQVQGTLSTTVTPNEQVLNTTQVSWTSTPGPNPDERTGDDVPDPVLSTPDPSQLNNYSVAAAALISVPAGSIQKVLVATSEPSTPGSSLTIGETATYGLVVTLPEGTVPDLSVLDQFSGANQEFVSFRVAKTVADSKPVPDAPDSKPLLAADFGGTLSDPTVTAEGSPDHSAEKFDFGPTVVSKDNDPTNNQFVIFVTTRILDNTSVFGVTPPGQTVPTDQGFLQTSPTQPQIPSNVVSLLVVEPQMQIAKSITPGSADAGDLVTITLNVKNTGTSNAFDVIVSDALPLGAFEDFAKVSGPLDFGFNPGTDSVTFSGGTVAVGQTVTFVYSAVLTAAVIPNQALIDTATVTQATTLPGTPTGERNEPQVSASTTLTVPLPRISKTLVATSDPNNIPAPKVTIGDTVTYEIVVTLPEGTTPNLSISDDFDPGMQVVPNTVKVITTAADAATNGVLLTNDFAGTLPTPTISGGKFSGDPGVVDFGQISVNPDNIAGNNSFLILVTVQVLDDPKTQGIPSASNGFRPSILPNTAELTAPFDPTISIVSNTVNVMAAEPNLVVTKSVDDPTPDIGETVNFTLTIQHTPQSTAIAYDVIAQDTLPSGLLLDLASINVNGAAIFSNGSAGNEVNLHLTDLPLGDIATITFSATVPATAAAAPGLLENNARIYWDTLPSQDPNTILTPGAPGDSQDRDYGAIPGYIEAPNPSPDDPAQDTVALTPVQDAIDGKVYQDVDVSGTFTPGDVPIPGVQLTLTGTTTFGQSITLSTTTDANGNYAFGALAPGTYLITETQPARFVDGLETPGNPGSRFGGIVSKALNSDTISQIVIPTHASDTEPNYNFGETLPASIAGSVYLDDNNDGIRQPGEQGIPAIPITLTGTDAYGQAVTATIAETNGSGDFQFVNLRPGTYSVVENDGSVVPSVFLDGKDTPGSLGGTVGGTPPKHDELDGISLAQGTAATSYNFGELRPASLAGTVYDDNNGDGTLEPGEPGIAEVTLTLTGTDDLGGSVNRIATTDNNGNYQFLSLRPGTYTISETQPLLLFDGDETIGSAGGVQLLNDQITRIPLAPATVGIGYNFGEFRSSLIQGSVYQDDNNNGLQDPGETGIRGVTVTLSGTTSEGASIQRVTTTNRNGVYRFVGLLPGTYTISESQPAAFLDGKEHVGSLGGALPANDVISSIPLVTHQAGTDYDFGELQPASISGSVYYDANDSGARDPGETGIPGTTIKLTGTDDLGASISQAATTDANGSYLFVGLRPGTYAITETQPAGFLDGEETIGSAGGQQLVNDQTTNIPLTPGNAASNYNFGEFKPSSIAGIVYLDRNDDAAIEPGEPDIAGVMIRLTGTDRNGSPVSLSTTTVANGRFVFTDLLPGNYQVNEIQPAGYFDGKETIGSSGGTLVGNDEIGKIALVPGTDATGYLFGERLNSDLVITKDDQLTQVVPGQPITYQITVSNQGPQDAETVMVTDRFPTAELDFVAASHGGQFDAKSGTIVWNLGRIANSNQQVVTLTVTASVKAAVPANAESVTNTVSTVDNSAPGPDPTPQNNMASDTDTLKANPDLFVTKTDNLTTISAGQLDTYMLTVGNRGDEGASGVIVRDPIPQGATFVSASNGGKLSNGKVVWNLGTVPAGARIELTVTVNLSLNATVNTLLNTVTVTDSNNDTDDPTPQDNTATDTTQINRFAYDDFNNFATFNPFAQSAIPFPRPVSTHVSLPSTPRLSFTFSGEADPGSTLAIEIIGPEGERVGYAGVVYPSRIILP